MKYRSDISQHFTIKVLGLPVPVKVERVFLDDVCCLDLGHHQPSVYHIAVCHLQDLGGEKYSKFIHCGGKKKEQCRFAFSPFYLTDPAVTGLASFDYLP